MSPKAEADLAIMPRELVTDLVFQAIQAQATPDGARAALEDLVARQRTWSARCAVEQAVRGLLVIEHFKGRSRHDPADRV
jgi:hypothetical protein